MPPTGGSTSPATGAPSTAASRGGGSELSHPANAVGPPGGTMDLREIAMKRSRLARLALSLLVVAPLVMPVTGVSAPPARLELTHPAGGHEVHVSAPAVTATADGRPLVAW